jgi:hypothetical protein
VAVFNDAGSCDARVHAYVVAMFGGGGLMSFVPVYKLNTLYTWFIRYILEEAWVLFVCH